MSVNGISTTPEAGALTTEALTVEEYAQFLGREDVGPSTLYHTTAWLEAVQDGLGMKIAVLGLFDSGELVGALPGFVVRKCGVRLFGAPLRGSMTPYMGWVLRRSVSLSSIAVLKQVETFCTKRLRCHYAEIGLLDVPADLAAGPGSGGWQVAQRETYMLDLRVGEAALWSNLGQRSRSKVKKALKAGVTIESVTDRQIIDVFYPMVEAAYGRHHSVPPHPKRFFLSLFDRLMPRGLMTVFAAKFEGKVVSASIVLHDEREARYMSNGSLAEYHRHCPNNLMQWHIIDWACSAGLHRYDFGGKGDPGIDRFKESFGPSPYAYTFYWRATPSVALARTLVLRAWPRVQQWRYGLRHLAERIGARGGQLGSTPAQQEGS